MPNQSTGTTKPASLRDLPAALVGQLRHLGVVSLDLGADHAAARLQQAQDRGPRMLTAQGRRPSSKRPWNAPPPSRKPRCRVTLRRHARPCAGTWVDWWRSVFLNAQRIKPSCLPRNSGRLRSSGRYACFARGLRAYCDYPLNPWMECNRPLAIEREYKWTNAWQPPKRVYHRSR